jgi:hypothetical protein
MKTGRAIALFVLGFLSAVLIFFLVRGEVEADMPNQVFDLEHDIKVIRFTDHQADSYCWVSLNDNWNRPSSGISCLKR